MTELPLWAGIVLGLSTAPSTVFSQPFGKKRSFGFKSKILITMNLMYRYTENISHVLNTGFDVTWVGKWHHSTFSLNPFLVLCFDTKMSHVRRRWKILRANQCYGNLPSVSINVIFRETVPPKTFPWIFPHTNVIKNIITFDVSNGVNISFFHIVYFKYIQNFKFYCNFCIHNFTIKCC